MSARLTLGRSLARSGGIKGSKRAVRTLGGVLANRRVSSDGNGHWLDDDLDLWQLREKG
jgi:hypothetical protein